VRRAQQKADSEAIFKLGDRLGDGGLTEPQLLGRTGERAGLPRTKVSMAARRSIVIPSRNEAYHPRGLPGTAAKSDLGAASSIGISPADGAGLRRQRGCHSALEYSNVRGVLFTVQKALPLLSRGSSVILIGSMVSIKGFASCSVYNASKAAIRSFARTWIVDLKGRDIRVNVLSPGYTETPGLSQFVTDEEKASLAASVPLGRIGVPDDLGKAAVFLASDDSAYVTGIELFVDGGAAQI
jgi:hypothetical protein